MVQRFLQNSIWLAFGKHATQKMLSACMTAVNWIFLPGVMSSQEKDLLLPTTSAKK